MASVETEETTGSGFGTLWTILLQVLGVVALTAAFGIYMFWNWGTILPGILAIIGFLALLLPGTRRALADAKR